MRDEIVMLPAGRYRRLNPRTGWAVVYSLDIQPDDGPGRTDMATAVSAAVDEGASGEDIVARLRTQAAHDTFAVVVEHLDDSARIIRARIQRAPASTEAV